MKALVLHGAEDLRVETVPDPGALGSGEIKLRNLYAGICGSDLHEFHRPMLTTTEPHPLTGASLPQIPGHEYSGEVLEVGEGVERVAVGDRVAVMPLFFCGRCPACMSGRQQCCARLGAVGMNWAWGGMAEQSIVQEHQVAVLPPGMSDRAGGLVEPAAVAIHSVTVAGVNPGDVVLVAGGGPIGQLVVLAAIAAGAGRVYLSETAEVRRRRAQEIGVNESFDPLAIDVPARLAELTTEGVDVAIDCAGNGPALSDCIRAVRRGGTVMQTALHTRPAELDTRDLTLRDITLRGANCFPVDSWPKVIDLIASGRMPVEKVITGITDLDSALDDGYAALLDPDGGQVKVLIDVGLLDRHDLATSVKPDLLGDTLDTHLG
jgi:(R,R)-butanediol dehydrogenase/meso-butanediol dehydrogenase/diacetyl reductase